MPRGASPALPDFLTDEEMRGYFPECSKQTEMVVLDDRIWQRDRDGWYLLDNAVRVDLRTLSEPVADRA